MSTESDLQLPDQDHPPVDPDRIPEERADHATEPDNAPNRDSGPSANSAGPTPNFEEFFPRRQPPSPYLDGAAPLDELPTRSTLFTKLPPDLRRRINHALAERQPPTYWGVYKDFDLQSHGVGFTAFYHYARRIRIASAFSEMKKLPLPAGSPLELLPEVLGTLLLDAGLDPGASTTTVVRLSRAFNNAQRALNDHRRFDLAAQRERRLDAPDDPESIAALKQEVAALKSVVGVFLHEHQKGKDSAFNHLESVVPPGFRNLNRQARALRESRRHESNTQPNKPTHDKPPPSQSS